MKKLLVFLCAMLFLFGFVGMVKAVPVINSTWLYTENWGPNDAGFPVGYYLAIGASVSDPVGVLPDIIASVIAQQGSTSISLPYQNIGPIMDAFYQINKPYGGETGIWKITATNTDGDTDSSMTHDLDEPRLIPLAENIVISDYSLTPTISWNPVFFDDDPESEVDGYRVRLVWGPYDQYYQSDFLTQSGFSVPEDVLTGGENVLVRIIAYDFDVDDVENRSNSFTEFTTPVPEPSTMLLLASGLIGLAGFRRKFIKR